MLEKTLLSHVLSVLIPESLSAFHLVLVKEHSEYIELRLEDLAELLPETLKKITNIVLDGYTNPLELQNFPLKGKPVYFKIYRHRWKESGGNRPHSHQYDLHPAGVKKSAIYCTKIRLQRAQSNQWRKSI